MEQYPKRKHPRLKQYDYSLPGYYYVTIHTEPHTPALSSVGRGRSPTEAVVTMTKTGVIVEQQLHSLEHRYNNVKIDKYVIMPNHIHVILRLMKAAGASPRPTVRMEERL